MIHIDNLRIILNKDQRTLVDSFSLHINSKDKIAIIGEEGNGKSSILKALADPKSLEEYATFELQGNILKSKISYVSQHAEPQVLEMTLKDYLSFYKILEDLDYTYLYQLIDLLGSLDPFEFEGRLLKSLSGGERMKLFLVLALVVRPDILVLDEPSNDLDIQTIDALESLLKKLSTPIIFVSHDEDLLRNVSNKIIHLELIKHKQESRHTISNLGYGDYIDLRNRKLAKQTEDYKNDKRMFEIKEAKYHKLHQQVESKLRGASRQDPASAKNLKDKMRSIKSMGKRYEKEKMNLTQKVVVEDSISFVMKGASLYDSQLVIETYLPTLEVDGNLLSKDISLKVFGPQKIVIIGENGAGKTTLLNVLMERTNPKLKIFSLSQDFLETMDREQTAIDFLSEIEDKQEIEEIRTLLGTLYFTPEEMLQKVKNLSGGQIIKLNFEKMRRSQAHVLFLDEPTRNLSPLTRPVMVQAIQDFKGAVVAVSHDRDFIRRAFDVVYKLDQDGLKEIDVESI